MKKISLLLGFLLLLSGCSVKRVQYTSYIDTINLVLEENIDLHNVSLEGYEYYLPKGTSLLEKSETNSVIQYQNTKLYLYVDIVSYFHDIPNNFTLDEDTYYARNINYNGKIGYIQITKLDKYYFVEFMYNYAKLEAYVEEHYIQDAIYQMSVILTSIRYHDTILESLIGENVINYKEETFNILAPKSDASTTVQDNVLDYEEETYEGFEGEIRDEDTIEIIEDEER